ncbi:hypothetical protein NMG60_11001794 [Bertholletia excelsa]
MENLESEIQRLEKENEKLRFLLRVVSGECQVLEANIQRKKEQQMNKYFVCNNKETVMTMEVPVAKRSQVFVRSISQDKNSVVDDGFKWRKYGQKVTKDNPSPRAYFKCATDPDCPVKKKVQRCKEDDSVLVMTYEGEHNHGPPSTPGILYITSSATPCSSSGGGGGGGGWLGTSFPSVCPSLQTTTLDLTLSPTSHGTATLHQNLSRADQYERKAEQRNIEDYVASFAKDPKFTLALAEAIASSVTYPINLPPT